MHKLVMALDLLSFLGPCTVHHRSCHACHMTDNLMSEISTIANHLRNSSRYTTRQPSTSHVNVASVREEPKYVEGDRSATWMWFFPPYNTLTVATSFLRKIDSWRRKCRPKGGGGFDKRSLCCCFHCITSTIRIRCTSLLARRLRVHALLVDQTSMHTFTVFYTFMEVWCPCDWLFDCLISNKKPTVVVGHSSALF